MMSMGLAWLQFGGNTASSVVRVASPRGASTTPATAASSAVSTTAARVPRTPRASIRPGTVAGGVQITASSGASGRLATSA